MSERFLRSMILCSCLALTDYFANHVDMTETVKSCLGIVAIKLRSVVLRTAVQLL